MLLDLNVPGMNYQALAPNPTPAELVFIQPASDSLYNIEIKDVRSSIDMAAMETLQATSIAQPEEVLVAEPAGQSVHVSDQSEDQDDLPLHAQVNLEIDSGTLGLQNVLLSCQYGSYAQDASVDRCDLKAPQLAKAYATAHS